MHPFGDQRRGIASPRYRLRVRRRSTRRVAVRSSAGQRRIATEIAREQPGDRRGIGIERDRDPPRRGGTIQRDTIQRGRTETQAAAAISSRIALTDSRRRMRTGQICFGAKKVAYSNPSRIPLIRGAGIDMHQRRPGRVRY
jgi:hypothetical protein